MFGKQEVRREWMEVALAHQDNAGRKRRDNGADNLRPRLLKRLREDADAEFECGGARKSNFSAGIGEIAVVGRVALPNRQDHIRWFGGKLVAVEIDHPD